MSSAITRCTILASVASVLTAPWASAQCALGKETFPLDPSPNSAFGYAVAVHADRIAAGAYLFDGLYPDMGAAYVFERGAGTPGGWAQIRKFTGNFSSLAFFGVGVAVQGETVAIGLPDDFLAGKVRVYEKDLGGPGFWGFGLLTPSITPSDGFGFDVSLEADTLLVGGSSLAAYVFERTGPGVWSETKPLIGSAAKVGDSYSISSALSGDTALVGSSRSDVCDFQSGAVYVFERNLGGPDNWGESHIICPSDPSFEDRFGDGVAIDGDTAVVSSFLEDSQAFDGGAVYVFYRDLGGPGNWGEVTKITVSDGGDDDWFGRGRSLAIQDDILLVGATGHDAAGADAGAVYVFQRDYPAPDAWGQIGKINGFRPGQEFGAAIAIDGDVTVIGAPKDDTFGPEAGAVYVFEQPWTLGGLVTYCTAGTSAAGCQALLSATGTASASLPSGFLLQADEVEGLRDGVFFFGTSGQQANSWGSGTSYQCVVPPVKRASLMIGTGTAFQCDGVFTLDLNAHWTQKPNHNPGAGAVVQTQLWYRDPFNTSNQTTSLSEAGEFGVCP